MWHNLFNIIRPGAAMLIPNNIIQSLSLLTLSSFNKCVLRFYLIINSDTLHPFLHVIMRRNLRCKVEDMNPLERSIQYEFST